MTLQTELEALIARHCDTLRRESAEIGSSIARLGDTDVDPAAVVAEATGLAHKLKGSSGSIGFRDVSKTAEALEHRLRSIAGTSVPPSEDDTAEILELFRALEALVAQISPEDSALHGSEITAVKTA